MAVDQQSLIIDRGMALLKMIRLVTLATGGEGWLNFMGNEFGHPEWIDFPREGNGWSYEYCRRQWSLVDNPSLRFKFLNAFDQAMVRLAQEARLLNNPPPFPLNIDETNHVMAFHRGGLVFVFNWSGDRITCCLFPRRGNGGSCWIRTTPVSAVSGGRMFPCRILRMGTGTFPCTCCRVRPWS